jgi:uncharacterized protein (DUF488 family)
MWPTACETATCLIFGKAPIDPTQRAAAIDDLEHRIRARQPVAIMCSEGKPDKCHKSVIAAGLSLRGISVVDLIAPQA